MNWIKNPLTLEGKKVVLTTLQETHFEELIANSYEEIIWTFMPVNGTDKEKLREALKKALIQKKDGEQYPFVVIDKVSNKIIGCTRFLKLNEEHRNLEIGWTWYVPFYWEKGTTRSVNFFCLSIVLSSLKQFVCR